MKVTIELNYNVILAISAGVANECAIEWFDSAVSDNSNPLTQNEIKTLYQYAFADGMQYLIDLIENKNTTDKQ